MKKIISTLAILIHTAVYSQNWEWVKLIQPFDNMTGIGIMVNPVNGNVYGGGGFHTSLNLGNGHVLSGNSDGFLTQFDTAGACQWTQRVYVTAQGCGCTIQGNSSGSGVNAFDSQGNLIVLGTFCGCGATFGSGITSAASGYNLFLAKYSPSGTCLWVKTKPGSFNPSTGQTIDEFNTIAVDESDNIYLSILSYANNSSFCGLNFPNQGLYLSKISSNGIGIWNKQTANTTTGYGIMQMKYANKRLYAAANYGATVSFGTNTLTAQGNLDVVALKLDTAGNPMAASDIGSTGNQTSTLGLAVSNNRIVVLVATGSPSLVSGTYTVNTSTGMDNSVLVAFDTTNLNPQAARNTANDNKGSGSALYSDFKGNIYVTVNNSATTGFGNLTNVPAGRHVIRMDNTLTNYWYTQSVNDAVAPDTLGNIYIIDSFSGSASYGSSLSETATNGITLGKINNAWATGISSSKMAQTNSMQVYPNPSAGLFNLKLSDNIKNSHVKIMLYDISGRLLAERISFTKEDENTLQINLSSYVEGTYYIKAEIDNVLYSAKLER